KHRVEERLLVIRPSRHRVVKVAVVLSGLDPSDPSVREVRNSPAQEGRIRHLIGVEDHHQAVADRAEQLTSVLQVAGLGTARCRSGDTANPQSLRQRCDRGRTWGSGDQASLHTTTSTRACGYTCRYAARVASAAPMVGSRTAVPSSTVGIKTK